MRSTIVQALERIVPTESSRRGLLVGLMLVLAGLPGLGNHRPGDVEASVDEYEIPRKRNFGAIHLRRCGHLSAAGIGCSAAGIGCSADSDAEHCADGRRARRAASFSSAGRSTSCRLRTGNFLRDRRNQRSCRLGGDKARMISTKLARLERIGRYRG
jgi:hypothetical protein